MRLILVRHGETEENRREIILGTRCGALSGTGIKQNKKVAVKLKGESIDFIFSSKSRRCIATTLEIAKFHHRAIIEFTNKLLERNAGKMQGKKKKDSGLSKNLSVDEIITLLRTGETLNNVYDRAKKLLRKIMREHKNETVLCVGHNSILKALITVIRDKPATHILRMSDLRNGAISIITVDDKGKGRVDVFNCTEHLR